VLDWAAWQPGTCKLDWLAGQPGEAPVEGGNGTEAGAHGPIGSIFAGTLEFLVTPLLLGPVFLISQYQFEEQVRPCLCPF